MGIDAVKEIGLTLKEKRAIFFCLKKETAKFKSAAMPVTPKRGPIQTQ